MGHKDERTGWDRNLEGVEMNKNVIGVVVGIAVVVLALPVVLQQLGGMRLEGATWEGRPPTEVAGQVPLMSDMKMTLEFLAEGRLIMKVDAPNLPGIPAGFEIPEVAGSWSREDDQVTIKIAGQSGTGTLEDNVIAFTNGQRITRVSK